MDSQTASNDILVVHQNRIIFRSGKGLLTQHSKISATVTQVLNLFSQKIMGGEQIHFIRFTNHRMIFLIPQDQKETELVAIVLIPISRNAKQIVPIMGIILRLVDQFLKGEILDAQNRHLDIFYQILTSPTDSLYVIPRSIEGILSALVLLAGFAHDMRFSLESIVSRMLFIDPSNSSNISSIIEASKQNRVLSFTPIPGSEDNENILVFGLKSELKQYFSANPREKISDVMSRIFGVNSNATKMNRFIDNDDAREIAQSISLFPPSEDDYIRYKVLLPTVIQPGKDIVVTMSAPVMHKLRELTPQKTEMVIPDLQSLVVEKTELEVEKQVISVPRVEVGPSIPIIELSAEPDAIPTPDRVITEKIEQVSSIEGISSDVISRLQKTRQDGLQYVFNEIPIVLDLAPLALNLSPKHPVPTNDLEITISVFHGENNNFVIHVYTHPARLNSIKDSLEDLSSRIEGKVEMYEKYISVEALIDHQLVALRGILWLSVVEYLTQVEMNIKALSKRFNIPNEGSILIIPPKRDFIQNKIPSKFRTFIKESEIREENETEALWTLGKTLDIILALMMKPLSQGDGVAFVASDTNQEMEEIALFLLLISEISGIGFSRW
ncbi:MAG: hypothetical protein KAT16_00535 [Candidatus Heimdallarchaeota archaeon]|nr:hypothetical protein [Candidatus Heimdallarchaeota archaeon]